MFKNSRKVGFFSKPSGVFSHVKKSLHCDCPFSLHATNRKKLQWDESGGLHDAGYFYSEVEDLMCV